MIRYLRLVCLFVVMSVLLCSCSREKVDQTLVSEVMESAKQTNDIKKYSASFLLEVTSENSENIILFAQGSYDADKSGKLILSGNMVQTVNASPASLLIAYRDGKYYAKSGEISTFTEIEEKLFLNQFLCAKAIVTDDVTSISKQNNGNGGIIYSFKADAQKNVDKLIPLIDSEVFYYDGMKKMREDTLSVSGLSCEYIVDEDTKLLKSRTIEYTETAYDTAPYYPNGTADESKLKHTLHIKIKLTYKTLDGTTNVVLPDFALNGE